MSLDVLNEYEKKLAQKEQVISELRASYHRLEGQHASSQQKADQLNQKLSRSDTQFGFLEAQLDAKAKENKELVDRLLKEKDNFKQLYDSCFSSRSLSARQQDLLLQGYELSLQTNNIKFRASEVSVAALQKTLSDKRETIRKVMAENMQLKENMLKMTQDYHTGMIQAKKGADLPQRSPTLSTPHQQNENTHSCPVQLRHTNQFNLKVKEIQFLQIKQRQQQLELTNRKLLVRTEELERLLQIATRENGRSVFDDQYVENQMLEAENQRLRRELEQIGPAKRDQYQRRMETYLKKGLNLSALEQKLIEKEKLLIQSRDSVTKGFSTEEIEHLRRQESDLTQKLEVCFVLLDKFNKGFKKINPHFKIYKYDMLNLDSSSKELLDDLQLKNSNDLVDRVVTLARAQRELASREEALANHKNVLLQQFQSYRSQIAQYQKLIGEGFVNITASGQANKILSQSTKTISLLTDQIKDLRRRDLIWQSQKRLLVDQKQLMGHNRQYVFVTNENLKYSHLQSIVVPNVVYVPPDGQVRQLLLKATGMAKSCFQSVHSLMEQHRSQLQEIHKIRGKIDQLNKTYVTLRLDHSSLSDTVQEKNSRIKELEERLKKDTQVERGSEIVQAVHQPIINHSLPFAGNSNISSQLISDLSVVLNHNQLITTKLLQELQTVKQQYTYLQSASKSIDASKESIINENYQLKVKLTEAIVELESTMSKEANMSQQMELIKIQRNQLQSQLDLRESENNQKRLDMSAQLQQLASSIESNVNVNSKLPLDVQLSQVSPDSESLIQIVLALKQVVVQKNQEITILENGLLESRRDHLISQQEKALVNQRDLSGLLQQTIAVITSLKSTA